MKRIIVIFAIFLALCASFYAGLRWRADFYVWLFYEPYFAQKEQVKNLKQTVKQLKQEIKVCKTGVKK